MPPRAVWKTRPSGVVPNLLMCARSSRTRTGGDGDGAGLVVGAMLQAAFLARGALIRPGPPGPGCRGRKDDPSPSGLRQVKVGLSQHDSLRRAQRRVVEAGGESPQGVSPPPPPPRGGQERPRLGGGGG